MNNFIIMDCFVLIVYLYPRTIYPNLFDANTNVLIVFMISLLQHLLQEYEEHET